MQRTIMKHVAEHCPQELRLRMRVAAQPGEFFRPVAFAQDVFDTIVHLGVGQFVFARVQIEDVDLLADFLVDTALGLLPERTLFHQILEPARQFKVFVPRVVGEILAHGVDHVREHVESDHIQSAEGGALGTAEIAPGQRIHHVEAEVECGRVVFGGEHGKHPDTVGDEIGRVLGAHHALTQGRDQKSLQRIEQTGFGCRAGNQLDQMHIARRVEEMDAAEAMAQIFGKCFGQGVDGKAGGVTGKDGALMHKRRDLAIQV